MTITKKTYKNGGEYYAHQYPEDDFFKVDFDNLILIFKNFLENLSEIDDKAEFFKNNVFINEGSLIEVFARVDKRKDYFLIFHDGTQISEIKRTALTIYWILKLKPFFINIDFSLEENKKFEDERFMLLYSKINERFSIYFLLSTIKKNRF